MAMPKVLGIVLWCRTATRIGVHAVADAAASFTVTKEGITVLGKSQPTAGDYSGAG